MRNCQSFLFDGTYSICCTFHSSFSRFSLLGTRFSAENKSVKKSWFYLFVCERSRISGLTWGLTSKLKFDLNYFAYHSYLFFFLFVLRINMERSSFYISHFFGARSKCLKLWVFRLGASRGIFFAVCCHFLFGGGRQKKDNWFCGVMYLEIKIRNWESPSHELQTWTDHTKV